LHHPMELDCGDSNQCVMEKAKRIQQFCLEWPTAPQCEEMRQCPPGGCINGNCVQGYCNCHPGWGGPNCADLLSVPVEIVKPDYIPPMEYKPPEIVTMPPWFAGPAPAPVPMWDPCPGPGPCPAPGPAPCPYTNLPGPCPAPGPPPCPLTNLPGPCPAPGPAPCPFTNLPGPCPTPSPCPGPGPCPAPSPCPGPGPCPAPSPCPGPGPCPAPSPCPGPGPCPAPGPAPCPLTGGPGPCPAPAPCPLTGGPGPCPAPAPCPFTNLPGPCPAPAPCPLTGLPGPCPAPAPCPFTNLPGPCPAPGPAPCPAPHERMIDPHLEERRQLSQARDAMRQFGLDPTAVENRIQNLPWPWVPPCPCQKTGLPGPCPAPAPAPAPGFSSPAAVAAAAGPFSAQMLWEMLMYHMAHTPPPLAALAQVQSHNLANDTSRDDSLAQNQFAGSIRAVSAPATIASIPTVAAERRLFNSGGRHRRSHTKSLRLAKQPLLNHTHTFGVNVTNATVAWTLPRPIDVWNLTALQTATAWAHGSLKAVALRFAAFGNVTSSPEHRPL